jgi:tRNA/rRNA methyltransferase
MDRLVHRGNGVTETAATSDSTLRDATAFARVRFVLAGTTHPGNIGAAARAIKTMGFRRLVLVAPKRYPHPEATALASGAADVLEAGTVHADLDEAFADVRYAVALTARRRDLALPFLDSRDAAQVLAREARAGEVALLFGNETYGLSNDEALRCHALVGIDTAPDAWSLNLAAAVQVMAYALRGELTGPRLAETPFAAVAHEDMVRFFARVERLLVAKGHLDPNEPRRLMERIRAVFNRTRLSRTEVDLLHGVLEALEK